MHLKLTGKHEQVELQIVSYKEGIRIRVEINETKTKRTTQRLTNRKNCFLQKRISKMDKFLCKLSKERKSNQ